MATVYAGFLDLDWGSVPVKEVTALYRKANIPVKIPVASREVFQHFERYLELKKSPPTKDWETAFLDEIEDAEEVEGLGKLADATNEVVLAEHCSSRKGKGHGDDEKENQDESENSKGTIDEEDDRSTGKRSPGPADENAFWAKLSREEEELYGEDKGSDSE